MDITRTMPRTQRQAFTQLRAASQSFASKPTADPVDSYQARQPVRVYVLDNFWKADEHTTHGELVEAELLREHRTDGPTPDVTVDRKHVDLYISSKAIEDGEPGALKNYLRSHFTTRLHNDTDAFGEIVETGGARSVIHQSQGASQSRAVEALYNRAKHNEDFRRALGEQLGVPHSEQFGEPERGRFLGALVAESNRIHTTDPGVKSSIDELRRLQDEAYEQGHVHVMSAGNQGALYREMNELGVEVPEKFFVNEMASSHTILVGASDDGSREAGSLNPHRVASIASPNAGAHVGADGVDRPLTVDGESGHHTGSSYAAPQTSSRVVDLLLQDPEIPQTLVRPTIQGMVTPLQGASRYLGDGYLRPN